MKSVEMIFAENLRAARRRRGLTQRELGAMLQYSEKSVSKWESGVAMPPSALLPALADALTCRVDDLLYDGDEPAYFLGVDGGGTKTELLLCDREGRRVAGAVLGASNPIDIGMDACRRVLDAGIAEVTRGIPLRKISAFFGLAGGISGDNREKIRAHLSAYGFGRCENGSDAQNAVAMALGDGDGVALIAGTGSIAFAKRGATLVRFGGYGYLLEDGGSGYAIGRDGIAYALKAEEGSVPRTPLCDAVLEKTGMPTVLSAIGRLYEGGKREIASYAPLVFCAHGAGDGAATEILERNAAALAALCLSSDRVFGDAPRALVMVGGLASKADIYLPMLASHLPRDGRFCLSADERKTVLGALRLAGLTKEVTGC